VLRLLECKKFEDMFTRFNRRHECDRWTDRYHAMAWAMLWIALCGKNYYISHSNWQLFHLCLIVILC